MTSEEVAQFRTTHILRRLVAEPLPPITEHIDITNFTKEEFTSYYSAWKTCCTRYHMWIESVDNAPPAVTLLLQKKFCGAISILRGISTHPELSTLVDTMDPVLLVDIPMSTKELHALALIKQFVEQGYRVVVFCSYTSIIRHFDAHLCKEYTGTDISRFYHGGCSINARMRIIKEFSEDSPKVTDLTDFYILTWH